MSPSLSRSDGEHAAFRAFLAAASRGDLAAIRRHFQDPTVLANVAMWNAVYRAQRLHEPIPYPEDSLPRPWYKGTHSPSALAVRALRGGRVEVFEWLFAREQLDLLSETLRRVVKTMLYPCFVEFSSTSCNMVAVILESPLFTEVLSDMERAKVLTYVLERAVSHSSPEWIAMLVAYGADPTSQLEDGTPLITCGNGDSKVLDALIEHGASIDSVDLTNASPFTTLRGWLEHGADANRVRDGVVPLLHQAARHCMIENVQSLSWDCIVDVDVRGENGTTPLMRAAESPRFIDKNDSPKEDVLKLLLDGGADVHAVDLRGRNVVHYAVRGWNASCLRLLLAHGADPNVRDDQGETPIDLIANYVRTRTERRFEEMHGALVQAGVDEDPLAAFNWSALRYI